MPSSLLRRMLHALVLLIVTVATVSVGHAHADTDPPALSPGFAHLLETAPDVVGQPLESEHPGDNNGSTVVRTTTGLLYWEPDLTPSWTDGYNRLTLDTADQLKKWLGDLLKPPAPPAFQLGPFTVGGGGGVDARIYCIEGIESHHGLAMWNATDIYGRYNGPGPHAHGWLGWLDGTAAHWGAIVGNRDSEWAAARRMFASSTEQFMRTQFYGVGAGLC